MAKDKKEMIEKPEFLTLAEPGAPGGDIDGMELLKDYRQLNFFKLIQGSSKPPFKPPFIDGDVITVPRMEKIIGQKDIFHFVPLFSYPEWCIHNPYPLRPYIVEKTLDPNHEIAQKARTRDKDVREFPCPQDPSKNCSYAEHLNFVVIVEDCEALNEEPIVMNFSVGEYVRGMSFLSLVRNRKFMYEGQKRMWINRFQASVSMHQKGENSWWGFDIINPEQEGEQPYVADQDKIIRYQAMAHAIKATFQEAGIDVDYNAGQDQSDVIDADIVKSESKF